MADFVGAQYTIDELKNYIGKTNGLKERFRVARVEVPANYYSGYIEATILDIQNASGFLYFVDFFGDQTTGGDAQASISCDGVTKSALKNITTVHNVYATRDFLLPSGDSKNPILTITPDTTFGTSGKFTLGTVISNFHADNGSSGQSDTTNPPIDVTTSSNHFIMIEKPLRFENSLLIKFDRVKGTSSVAKVPISIIYSLDE